MGGQGDLGGPGSQKVMEDRCSDKERQTKRMTKRERTRGRRKLSRGTRLQTHAPTPPTHTHTCTHTELCPGRLLIPLGIHELDMLWAPDTRVPPRVCYPLGCFVFQSTAQETLLGHWCYLSVHDRGQSIAKQLLLDTTLPSHPPPQPLCQETRRLGSGRHNGSISELQTPEPFTDGEMGAPGGEQSQKQSFQGYLSLLPDQGWSLHHRLSK